AILNAILNESPANALERHAEVPPELGRVIAKALDKDRAYRYANAGELLNDLDRTGAAVAAPVPVRQYSRALVVAAAAVALFGGGFAAQQVIKRNARIAWARGEALPEIARLAGRDANSEAFALANQVASILPNDPALAALWPRISVDLALDV